VANALDNHFLLFQSIMRPINALANPLRLSCLFAALIAAFGASNSVCAATVGGIPGDLLVSSTNYYDPGFAAGIALPYSSTFTSSTLNATAGSAFCASADCSSNVWTNSAKDGNFGVSSGITIQSVNPKTGAVNASLDVTALAAKQGINLVTSFASKSELAINLTPDRQSLTFMGYNATKGLLDISNANAYAGSEPGNTDIQTPTQRGVAQLNLSSQTVQVTNTGAYSGNNGRAAILAANGSYYAVGNSGNGSGSTAVTNGAGVQLVVPGSSSLGQNPVGAYNITQNGYLADKTAKDSNYRGETIFNNTLYVSKGSGGNGINTVYQVGTAGTLPPAGSSTPVAILPGFNTALAKTTNTPHPFGIFFANASTLYVADEGSGASTDFGTNPTTMAGGLQKYSLVDGTWQLDYTLKGSLIGTSYTVSDGTYSLSTTTDGLRNLTGRVNADGTVSLFAVTSTEGSKLGDAGADPNMVVVINDMLSYTSLSQAISEDFTVLQTAALGQAFRGVAITDASTVPLPATAWLLVCGVGAFGAAARPRKAG
jgi:hypothetical protein